MTADHPEGPGERKDFGHNVAVSIAFTVLGTLGAFINNVTIARLGGPDERGLYAIVVSATSLAWVFLSLGLTNALTWRAGRGVDLGGLWAKGWVIVAVVTAICLPASLGVAHLPSRWVEGGLDVALRYSLWTLPPMVLGEVARGIWLGRNRVLLFNASVSLTTGVCILLNVLLLGSSDEGVLQALLGAHLAVALAAAVDWIHSGMPLRWPGRDEWRESIRFGLTNVGVSATETALLRVDSVLVSPVLSLRNLGVYAVADQMAHLLSWSGLVAGRMMFRESSADGDGAAAARQLSLAVRAVVTVIVLVLLAFIPLGGPAIRYVFGEEFNSVYAAVLVFFPSVFARALVALYGGWLAGQNHQGPVARAGLLAVAVLVLGALPAASVGGAIAVAALKSASMCLQFVLILHAFRALAPPGLDRRWFLSRDDVRTLRRSVARRLFRTHE